MPASFPSPSRRTIRRADRNSGRDLCLRARDRRSRLAPLRDLCAERRDERATDRRPAGERTRGALGLGGRQLLIISSTMSSHQDGSIRVAVGATGIDAVKGVASQSMKDATAAADTRYGTLVAPGLVAPFHSHYFNFRLDLDIDGTANDFMRERLVQEALPKQLAAALTLHRHARHAGAGDGGAHSHRAGLARALSFRQQQCGKRAWPPSGLHADAGRKLRLSAARGRRSAGAPQSLHRLPTLGHALRPHGALRRRTLRGHERPARTRSAPGPRRTGRLATATSWPGTRSDSITSRRWRTGLSCPPIGLLAVSP